MTPLRRYRLAVLLLAVALLGTCAGPELLTGPAEPARAAPAAPAASDCGGPIAWLAMLPSELYAAAAGALLVTGLRVRRTLRHARRHWSELGYGLGWGGKPRRRWSR